MSLDLDELLDFVVDGQDEGSSGSTENVGEGSLEHGGDSFVLDDLLGAVEGVLVKDVLAS